MLLLAFFRGIFFWQINDRSIVPFLVPLVLTEANQVKKKKKAQGFHLFNLEIKSPKKRIKKFLQTIDFYSVPEVTHLYSSGTLN